MTKSMSPEEIAEMSEDCQCSCKELQQLRGNLSLAEEGLANYALEMERKNSLIDLQDEAQTSLHAENVNLRLALNQMKEAIYWALGERGEFADEPEPQAGKPRRRFWWRTELRRRSCLPINGRPDAIANENEPLPVAGWNKCECAGCPGLIPSQGASRDASPGSNAWADAKGGLPDNTL